MGRLKRLLCRLGLHSWSAWRDLPGWYCPIERTCSRCQKRETRTLWDGWNP